MRAYDFTPLILGPVMDGKFCHIFSLRRCPRCRTPMYTDGKGKFFCKVCDYQDWQDVSKLAALKYPGEARSGWRRQQFGRGKVK